MQNSANDKKDAVLGRAGQANGLLANQVIGNLTKPETSQELVFEAAKLGKVSALINNASQREFNKLISS